MTPASRAFAPLDLLQLLAIALIWGVNNIAAKIALQSFPALLTVTMRFVIVLTAVGWLVKAIPKDRVGLFLLMLVCVGPLHFGVQYVGLHMADQLAPLVVAMQLWAPASVIFAGLLLKERISPLRQAGVGAAFAGIAVMAFDPGIFSQWQALLLTASAAFIYGLGAVLVRRMGGGLDPWATQAWIALATAPVSFLGSALFEREQWAGVLTAPWSAWACVAFGGIVSGIVANAFMFRLVQRYEVSRTTPYLLLTPVISFALSALVLGDDITPRLIAGAACTMGGVALVALAERRFKAIA